MITKVIKYDLPFAKDGMWLLNLAEVVRPLNENLYTDYVKQSTNPTRNGISEYRSVTVELRQILGTTKKTSGTIA